MQKQVNEMLIYHKGTAYAKPGESNAYASLAAFKLSQK